LSMASSVRKVIKLFSSLTMQQNKLECFTMNFFSGKT
jgi:hypothetical protein